MLTKRQAGNRAEGSAPYGYRLVPAYTGTNAERGQVVKNKLEPDPETAPFVKEYFERRALGDSRASILKDFNRRGVRPPRASGESPRSQPYSMRDSPRYTVDRPGREGSNRAKQQRVVDTGLPGFEMGGRIAYRGGLIDEGYCQGSMAGTTFHSGGCIGFGLWAGAC